MQTVFVHTSDGSCQPHPGQRHYPDEFAQTAELGIDHFDKRSAAEVERDFPGMVRAGSPLHVDADVAQQLAVGEPDGLKLNV